MISRSANIVQVRDGEYRGLWSEQIVTIEPRGRVVTLLMDDMAPQPLTPVIVVIIGGYAVAETIFSEV